MARFDGRLASATATLLLLFHAAGCASASRPAPGEPPRGLAYADDAAVYTIGITIAANTPSLAGGVATGFAVSPALPAGLVLHATTGVISGTPSAVSPTASYTVTASNAAGSASAAVSITVNDQAGEPPAVAATPAFAPPGGTYSSAQTVTITSATPGAVIHCTQDGSPPTTASPACGGPLVLSSTTTVRAIAAAAGYAPSAVASATYAFDTRTTAEKLRPFATRRMWFAHMSVGINVWYGAVERPTATPAAGLGRLILDHPTAGNTFGELYAPDRDALAAIPAGRWAETSFSSLGAPNSYPLLKLAAFAAALGSDFGGGLDHAIFKLCFADVDVSVADTDAVWAEYQAVMDPLEAAFPGRLVHVTVPLTTYEGANVFRERLSSYLRGKYGPTGRVFDLADLESRDPEGNLVLGANGLRTMNPAWHSDGAHLNAAGANHVAERFLDFMYRLEPR